jgi:hypothetical protein
VNREVFFDSIRDLFPGKKILPLRFERLSAVLDGLEARNVGLRHAAYILATAFWESDRFKTMVEYASGEAYEGRKDLGNTVAGDGVRFKGRGLVQITGRKNYSYWAKRLGVDLLVKPHLTERLDIAVPILIEGSIEGTFTGRKLADFGSYSQMRRVINGTDKAKEIAEIAEDFEQALSAADYGARKPTQKPIQAQEPKPAPKPAPTPPSAPAGSADGQARGLAEILAAIVKLIAGLFRKGK